MRIHCAGPENHRSDGITKGNWKLLRILQGSFPTACDLKEKFREGREKTQQERSGTGTGSKGIDGDRHIYPTHLQ